MREPTFDNRNENHINLKTDSIVELIKELSKLGVFKTQKKHKRAAGVGADQIKQDNEMVGYTKSLDSPQMRNLPPIQQIEPGATQNQIEDIQRQNNAVVAALREEVMQNRIEDINRIGSALFSMSKQPDRFRGSTQNKPYDPFASTRNDVILLGNAIPDIQQERFDQSINEGGPEAVEEIQTTSFPTEPMPPIIQKARTKLSSNRRVEVTDELDIDPPPSFKSTTRPDMEKYYRTLFQVLQIDIDESILTSKQKMFNEINSILDSYVA